MSAAQTGRGAMIGGIAGAVGTTLYVMIRSYTENINATEIDGGLILFTAPLALALCAAAGTGIDYAIRHCTSTDQAIAAPAAVSTDTDSVVTISDSNPRPAASTASAWCAALRSSSRTPDNARPTELNERSPLLRK